MCVCVFMYARVTARACVYIVSVIVKYIVSVIVKRPALPPCIEIALEIPFIIIIIIRARPQYR